MSSGLAMKAHSLWKIRIMGRGYEPHYQTKSENPPLLFSVSIKKRKKPHQASLLKSGIPTKSLEKVTPISVHPNFSNPASYPSVRDLEDLLPGFKGQPNTTKKKKILHTLYESKAEQEKGDVMEDGDGKLELLPRKGTAILEKPRDEGSKVKRPTQLSLTCESPSLFARSVRLPLVDLSNTLDSPICTSIPLKPSWTRINRSLFEPEDILEVFVRKKKGSHYPRKMNKVLPKKKKKGFLD